MIKLNESIIKNLNEAEIMPDTPEFSEALTTATYYVNEAAKLYRQYANWAADVAADIQKSYKYQVSSEEAQEASDIAYKLEEAINMINNFEEII